MLFVKRVVLIFSWWGALGAYGQTDSSTAIEPSHFFMSHPLLALEDILDSPDAENAFNELSPQERAEFAACIAALSDAFLAVLLESTTE